VHQRKLGSHRQDDHQSDGFSNRRQQGAELGRPPKAGSSALAFLQVLVQRVSSSKSNNWCLHVFLIIFQSYSQRESLCSTPCTCCISGLQGRHCYTRSCDQLDQVDRQVYQGLFDDQEDLFFLVYKENFDILIFKEDLDIFIY
jgi:hypothetical protein